MGGGVLLCAGAVPLSAARPPTPSPFPSAPPFSEPPLDCVLAEWGPGRGLFSACPPQGASESRPARLSWVWDLEGTDSSEVTAQGQQLRSEPGAVSAPALAGSPAPQAAVLRPPGPSPLLGASWNAWCLCPWSLCLFSSLKATCFWRPLFLFSYIPPRSPASQL